MNQNCYVLRTHNGGWIKANEACGTTFILQTADTFETLSQAQDAAKRYMGVEVVLFSLESVPRSTLKVRRNNEVNGLTAGLFYRIEEELLKAPPSDSRGYALRCLAEIHDQFDERHNAAYQAEADLCRLAEAAERARQNLHNAHVDFGGVWNPRTNAQEKR